MANATPTSQYLPEDDTPWAGFMTEHALITVTGPDAIKVLQGQLTCDVRKLDEGLALIGGHCTHKGRMISSFVMAAHSPEAVWLRVRQNLAETALINLKKYLVFSKAEAALSNAQALAMSANAAHQYLGTVPNTNHSIVTPEGLLSINRCGFIEVWGDATKMSALWTKLAADIQRCEPNAINQALIQAGIADIQKETSEAFIPQMLNFDELEAISYKKGCYTGQEIIARLHYKGQSKKHTLRVLLEGVKDLKIGDEMTTTEGHLLNIAATANTPLGTECLVVAPKQSDTSNTVKSQSGEALNAQWKKLPYAIPL